MLNSTTEQEPDSHSTKNYDTSTSKRSILLYTIFGLCIFFKPGDPYLWETCTTSNVQIPSNSTTSNSSDPTNSPNSAYTPLGKGITETDTMLYIIPFYYVTNLLLATPVYLLVSKYNLLKQCHILHAIAALLGALLFATNSFITDYNARLVETLLGEIGFAAALALEPGYFSYIYSLYENSDAEAATAKARKVYDFSNGIGCLCGYFILLIWDADYVDLFKVQAGFAGIALVVATMLPDTRKITPKNDEIDENSETAENAKNAEKMSFYDFSIKLLHVYRTTKPELSILSIGVLYSSVLSIGYSPYLWMAHSDYADIPTKFNGIVFAVSWLLSSFIVSVYEKFAGEKYSKTHGILAQIGTVLFCFCTTVSVLILDKVSIWVLYGVYVIYLSIGQYLLTVFYSEINKQLEKNSESDGDSHSEVNYFQAIYGFNQFLAFLVSVIMIYLVAPVFETNFEVSATFFLFYSSTVVVGVGYLVFLFLK